MAASFQWDDTLREWAVVLPDGSTHHAKRITVDTPCDGRAGVMEFTETQMTFSNSGNATLGRDTPLPHGYVNDPVMLDWQVRRDPETRTWIVFNSKGDVATTRWLTLDCHAESLDGILHCRAECLVGGSTFAGGAIAEANEIHLRTLVVYNQEVAMNVMAISKSRLAAMGG